MKKREFDENDDIAVMIDAVMTRPGLRKSYESGGRSDWISRICDQDIEDGIKALPEMEQQILEKYYLQGKPLIGIAEDLGISMDLLGGHLKAVKERIRLYV